MKEYDVVVVGGGTAGAIAAISAAKMGSKTLIIEKLAGLGGSMTFALVTPFMNLGLADKKFVNSGLGKAILEELNDRGTARGGLYNPEDMKVILEEKALEAGVELLYDTAVIRARAEGRKITEVDIFNSDGISTIRAKEFIDCSGNAQLSKLLNVAYMSGNAEGVNQSATLRFEIGNVDFKKLSAALKEWGQKYGNEEPDLYSAHNANPVLGKLMKDAVESGELTQLEGGYIQFWSAPGCYGKVCMNCPETGSGKNVSSAAEQTRRIIQGRRSAINMMEFCRRHIPGFENCYLSQIASLLGIRESERIHAEYDYTVEDVRMLRRFPDAVVRNNYPIDIHIGWGDCIDEESDPYDNAPAEKHYMELPLRSLIAKEYDNLMVAGRCAGMDFLTQSAFRIMEPCQAMGEAAGIAASLAIREGKACKDVDGVRVREIMRERGSSL